MKKLLCIIAATVLALTLAACGTVPGAQDTLTGTPGEIMTQLKETVDLGMTFDDEVTADKAQYVLGLTEAQFGEFVESAYEAAAAIATFAQSNVVIKCKDANAAIEVKKLIAEGFDSHKWICVFPEQSAVVESGSYVLLAVGTVETTNALVEAFKALSGGNTGSPDVFFTFDGEAGGDIDFGGGEGIDLGGGELILP